MYQALYTHYLYPPITLQIGYHYLHFAEEEVEICVTQMVSSRLRILSVVCSDCKV